jgi:hypothetical protein
LAGRANQVRGGLGLDDVVDLADDAANVALRESLLGARDVNCLPPRGGHRPDVALILVPTEAELDVEAEQAAMKRGQAIDSLVRSRLVVRVQNHCEVYVDPRRIRQEGPTVGSAAADVPFAFVQNGNSASSEPGWQGLWTGSTRQPGVHTSIVGRIVCTLGGFADSTHRCHEVLTIGTFCAPV